MLQQKDGVIILQRLIISSILRVHYAESISNDSEGVNIIRNRISRFKFLIVLDDVDEKFELNKILGNIENFVPESRLIITSRNVWVLRTLTDDCKLYRILQMDHHDSLQLFCNHAFRKDFPPSSYETLSKDIVLVAAGLPLTLKAVGSLLFLQNEEFWKEKLMRLKKIPEEQVMERLMISYDTLDAEAQEIFLDIACFFIGVEKELAFYMWNDCGFFPTVSINILIQMSMIEIAPNYHGIASTYDRKKNLFQMHDQLRDMGREIIRKRNTCPWKRSKIWSEEEALDILRNKKGTDQVTGIRIHYNAMNEFRKLGCNRIHNDGYMEFKKKKFKGIRNESFMKLLQLRYLDIHTDPMLPINDLSNYVPNLRWLRFHSGDFWKFIPKVNMENLVILEILYIRGDESEALRRIKISSKLKVLKLSHCSGIEFPELPYIGSLEILDVDGCSGFGSGGGNLDIGNLGNLKVLRLQDCGVRGMSCGTVGMIPLGNVRVQHLLSSSLTTLHIKKCPKLEWLPSLGNLDSLTYLCIAECPSLKEIVGIGGLKSLETLTICSVQAICNLDGLDRLYSLTSLCISYCDALERLPNMVSLSKLIHLYISYCPRLTEIRGLGGLKSLETLTIYDVEAVCNLDGLDRLYSLTSLSLSRCGALERLPSMTSLSKLIKLDILYCPRLTEIRGLGVLRFLETLKLHDLTVRNVDGLDSLYSLKFLKLLCCDALETLPTIASLSKLLHLDIFYCPLTEIRGLEGLKLLQVLRIVGSQSLTRLLRLETLLSFNKLKTLKISSCCLDTSIPFHELDDGRLSEATILDSLQEIELCGTKLVLPIFSWMVQLFKFPSLTKLTLSSAGEMENADIELRLDGLVFMEALVALRLDGLICRLPSLSKLGNLRFLTVCYDPKLREIEGLSGLKSLEDLDLEGCTALERLPADELYGLERLKSVDIMKCRNLIDLSALTKLQPKVKVMWPDSSY